MIFTKGRKCKELANRAGALEEELKKEHTKLRGKIKDSSTSSEEKEVLSKRLKDLEKALEKELESERNGNKV